MRRWFMFDGLMLLVYSVLAFVLVDDTLVAAWIAVAFILLYANGYATGRIHGRSSR